jgi:hypothetical protein
MSSRWISRGIKSHVSTSIGSGSGAAGLADAPPVVSGAKERLESSCVARQSAGSLGGVSSSRPANIGLPVDRHQRLTRA